MEDHVATFNLNTIAVLLTTFAFLELLDVGNQINADVDPSRPKSQVVTVSSAGAFFRGYGDFVYNASKAGTTHMMKHMATALTPWDIRCNIIAPGCELSLSIARSYRQVSTNSVLSYRVPFSHYYRSRAGI